MGSHSARPEGVPNCAAVAAPSAKPKEEPAAVPAAQPPLAGGGDGVPAALLPALGEGEGEGGAPPGQVTRRTVAVASNR